MKKHYYDLFTRVLIYKEGGKFVAHALDLDLLGYGNTENSAKKELERLVANQLSFSAIKEKPEMVNFPAPKEFFRRWEKASRAQLSGELTAEKPCKLSTKATVIGFAVQELKKLRHQSKRTFAKTGKLAIA